MRDVARNAGVFDRRPAGQGCFRGPRSRARVPECIVHRAAVQENYNKPVACGFAERRVPFRPADRACPARSTRRDPP